MPFSDRHTPLQLTDMPVAVLFVLAIASIGIYGIVLGGWSSGSTYSLLGGLRSSAQMISYEVAMGLALVAVFLYAGSMSTSEIVAAQDKLVVRADPAAVVRDLRDRDGRRDQPRAVRPPRGRGRAGRRLPHRVLLLKFALFFLAEYINMATVSALATTLFLGGWHAPFWIDHVWAGANSGYWPFLWFIGKVLFFIFIFIWLRGTLPRLRYDQFMAFGWKRLIPVSLVWIVAVATIRAISPRRRRRPQYLADRRSASSWCCSWCCSSSATQRRADERAGDEPTPTRSPAASRCRRCPPAAPSAVPPAADVRHRAARPTPPSRRTHRRR